MKIVDTITQSSCTYRIYQIGNRSYRIDWVREGERKINHVDKVFDTKDDCLGFIATCKNMDALISKLDYNALYQKDNIRRIVVKVNRKTNPEIAAHLDTIDNVQGYILNLIRNDIKADN